MTQVLVVVIGLAGTGKSEVGKRLARLLAAVYLDKDTLSRGFVEELLAAHSCPTYDRESETYLTKVRPQEYRQMMRAAMENLECGQNVVICAPFIAESQDPEWFEALEDDADVHGADVRVVWVRSDEEAMQRYISDRNAERDRWKRLHWDEYLSGTQWDRPPAWPHDLIDNSMANADRAPVAQIREVAKSWGF